jgi:hypothetical protein
MPPTASFSGDAVVVDTGGGEPPPPKVHEPHRPAKKKRKHEKEPAEAADRDEEMLTLNTEGGMQGTIPRTIPNPLACAPRREFQKMRKRAGRDAVPESTFTSIDPYVVTILDALAGLTSAAYDSYGKAAAVAVSGAGSSGGGEKSAVAERDAVALATALQQSQHNAKEASVLRNSNKLLMAAAERRDALFRQLHHHAAQAYGSLPEAHRTTEAKTLNALLAKCSLERGEASARTKNLEYVDSEHCRTIARDIAEIGDVLSDNVILQERVVSLTEELRTLRSGAGVVRSRAGVGKKGL